jgi:hypothetical protein
MILGSAHSLSTPKVLGTLAAIANEDPGLTFAIQSPITWPL